ncbi:hypothetical protein [Streptomyces sp. NPDC000888]
MLADLGTAAITGTRKPRGRDLTDFNALAAAPSTGSEGPWNANIAHLVNWKILDTESICWHGIARYTGRPVVPLS